MIEQKHMPSEHAFYVWFKLLVVALIILNMVDTITTIIGYYYVDGLSEGNALLIPFLSNVYTYLTIKAVVLSGLFLAALGYLFKIHHAFPKLWENEVGLTVSALVVLFYMYVVTNNFILILVSL